MRNPNKHTRLKQVRGQIFTCGMFGTCSNSVLSPPSHEHSPNVLPPDATTLPLKQDNVLLVNPHAISIQRQDKITGVGTRFIAERRFERIPSSTQWDFALEQEGRFQNRSLVSGQRDLCPDLATKDRLCEDSAKADERCLEILAKQTFEESVVEADVKNLRLLAGESLQMREYKVEAGVPSDPSRLLISTVSECPDCCHEEAFGLLLALSDSADTNNMLLQPYVLGVIKKFLLNGSSEYKKNAMSFLLKIISRDDLNLKASVGCAPGIMESLLKLLDKCENVKLSKHAIKVLLALCLCKQNRYRAVKVGAVKSLLELLPNLKSVSAERALATLELLCTTPDGRTAFLHHALAIPLIVTFMFRVSDRGTEYAAGLLCSICTPENVEAQEMALQVCAPTQLLLLLQSDCTDRARRKALKLLKDLHRFCENDDTCIPAAQQLND